jgi:hypothetical protein
MYVCVHLSLQVQENQQLELLALPAERSEINTSVIGAFPNRAIILCNVGGPHSHVKPLPNIYTSTNSKLLKKKVREHPWFLQDFVHPRYCQNKSS